MASMQPVSEQQAITVIDLVYRAARSIADEARQAVGERISLEIGEFVLLRAVDGGDASPSRLAEMLHAHPAAISRSVTKLVRAGLLERRLDSQDSRRTELHLTPEGRATVGAIAQRVRPFVQACLVDIPPGGIATTLPALAALGTRR